MVNPILECDQVPSDEFAAGAVEFVTMADLEHFPQSLVRIEADALRIGNSNEHKIKKLLDTGQSLVEPLAKESVVNPTE